MIEQALKRLSAIVVKPIDESIQNEWKDIKIQSTVDEGRGMSDIERKQHLYKEIRK